METVNKLKNSKEVIAYLAEQFPASFSVQGEAKPLKIGIFQDLAERLKDDECVSNTLIRSALRQYTSSWRYLHSIKPDAARVDLDGNTCAVIEQEHIDHAKQKLKESKDKAFGAKKKETVSNERPQPSRAERFKDKTSKSAKSSKPQLPRQPKVEALAADEIKSGKAVRVLVGRIPMPGVITEVVRDDISVQLNSGMQVKVKKEHIVA
jgi:ProP effector